MSLIVTSSSKDPNNVRSQGVGIQSPFSYQNTFRSPLLIKPNSEVAVQSVRCNREGFSFNHDSYFCIYWGKELDNSESITADHVTNQPIYVKIEAGSYTSEEFRLELQTNLSNTLKKAYPNIIDVTVQLNSDAGFTFTLKQSQNATYQDLDDTKWIPVMNSDTRDTDGGDDLDLPDSGAVSASLQVVTASAAKAYAINTTAPLALTSGEFSVDPRNASNGGWKIGLTRNLYDPQENAGTYTIGAYNFDHFLSDPGIDGEDDFFDYVAVWDPGSDLKVFHYIMDPFNVNSGAMAAITPFTTITNASLVAGFYDRVKFEFINEKINLQMRQTSGSAWVNVVNSVSATGADKLFKPTGLTTQALYPKIYIENATDNVEIDIWDGLVNTGNVFNFYENKLFGTVDSGNALEVVEFCDTNKVFRKLANGTYNPTYTRLGVNASSGQDYKYVFIFAENPIYDTILDNGYLHKNLRGPIGFKTNINTQTGIPATGTPVDVIIVSQSVPKELGAGSLFIRVNNLPFNSLNGATESISQMLYACPRFDTNGNTTGGLYYEPSERVYVSLNNPDQYVLSDLSIDIVDINERVADDLEGNTIVTLHIRQGQDRRRC